MNDYRPLIVLGYAVFLGYLLRGWIDRKLDLVRADAEFAARQVVAAAKENADGQA